ncbi:hypothetical protein [Tritonibacter scottomollicae]|uniref:hypothetical protein n=1 Tax=Tritonibacter scottomollicae TaxID=483013 RepID=UPI003AA87FC8
MLRKQGEAQDDRRAKATGFACVSQGANGIRAALDILTRSQDGGHIVNQGELGPLFKHLKGIYLDDDAFEGFRGILRDYFLEIWPLRQVMTFSSRSSQSGVSTPLR